MAVRTFDGGSKADRKGCAVFRTTPKYLATIDFGTTHCSVAYLLRPDMATNPSEVDPTVLKLDNAGNKRVPSCILFDSNGKKVAFGHEAREQFAALNHELRHQHHYFEHVKKNLQYEKVPYLQQVLWCVGSFGCIWVRLCFGYVILLNTSRGHNGL